MWIRAELKLRAKDVLRKGYWKLFAVSLLVAIVSASIPTSLDMGKYTEGKMPDFTFNIFSFSYFNGIAVTLMIFAAVILFGFSVRLFIANPLQVGGTRYFVKAAQSEDNVEGFKYAFCNENYPNIFMTMIVRDILIFLWTLLLIVPGIIKHYQYCMVPFILADNPTMGYKRALQLSRDMTQNQKGDIFVLDLSFIGWLLLGSLALGVGTFFVYPYINATNAELYLTLRKNALDAGLCTHDELRLQQQIQETLPE